MTGLYDFAMDVARNGDVRTPVDSLVLYSISFLPTAENKERAFAFLKNNSGSMMIDQTPAGRKLIEIGLLESDLCGLPQEEIAEIWKVASKRLIEQASGNITAFVEKADPRSVFRVQELPELLKNPHVKTVNGIDKFEFARQFQS